jgi:hypothetical protein
MEIDCHAGFSACDHPIRFSFGGEQLAVERVLAEWRHPDGKRWLVLSGGSCFQLELDNTGASLIKLMNRNHSGF